MDNMRSELQAIAHRAMVERGLLPDFSAAALAESQAAAPGVGPVDPSVRDHRRALWCSIDNDDSRDLDQLTVGEALPAGAARILIA
ncbi:MAG TPA: RNB domain-containing ribonuclease, partial [Polyangia bacterium]